MYELARNYGKTPVILKEIARLQDISEKYLSKLIIPLKGAHLINSSRGSHGGYSVARDPSTITLKEIVEILEGDITPVECVKNPEVCPRTEGCPSRDVWCRLDRAISGLLEEITLDDLVNEETEKMETYNYII